MQSSRAQVQPAVTLRHAEDVACVLKCLGSKMHRQSNEKETKHDEKYPDVQQWFGTTFTNNKAGMAEVNKEKVKRVVYDMSKVPFFILSLLPALDNICRLFHAITCATIVFSNLLYQAKRLADVECRILHTSSMASDCRARQKRESER